MSDSFQRLTAALSDRYTIERELGQGGMATVYLAHDLKHDRDVAIKVLKPELAAVIGAERFLSEIRTTANLQHPHILALFDSGEVNGTVFYSMPFVEGESLRDLIMREKQLAIADAVRIASQVAGALDYAHRHGVIHRDIKPENILLHDDQALIADFGIALAVSAGNAGNRMTETGMSLGTPHYMSPEQAMGERDLDARADVYALGCVLYEMLAGEPPFTGPTAQAIIAKLMSSDPEPVTTLRRAVAPGIAVAVHTAIQKLPADRFGNAREFLDALRHPGARVANPVIASTGRFPTLSPHVAWTAIAALAALTIIAGAMALRSRSAAREERVTRLALAIPAGQEMLSPGGVRLAFAPDGRSFAYPGPGDGRPRLWRRWLDRLEASPIEGSEGATSAVFSPDGSQIAFMSLSPFTLKVVPANGGEARTIVSDQISGGGVAWSDDGYLYFDGSIGLARIRPDGSDRSMAMPLDTATAESGIGWPAALPNGRGIIYRIRHGGESIAQYTVVVLDLRRGIKKDLVSAVSARYSPSGYLLFVTADGTLHAQRFNLDKLELEGEPATLWTGVAIGGFGAVDLALSPSGDLLYSLGSVRNSVSDLTWVARDGQRTAVDSAPEDGLILDLALSPDGSAVALETFRSTSGTSNLTRIYVKDLGGGPTQLVSSEPVAAAAPTWFPDGRQLLYASGDGARLIRRRADGSGDAIVVARLSQVRSRFTITPDGSSVVLVGESQPSVYDLMRFRLGVDSVPTMLLAGPTTELEPQLSPDGHWLAYSSSENGTDEIYVRPFPAVDSARVQISVDGGRSPRWRHDGKEIFYVSGNGEMTAVELRYTPAITATNRTTLFSVSGYLSGAYRGAVYDVSPDGKRFLMLDLTGSPSSGSGQLVLVQHFDAEVAKATTP